MQVTLAKPREEVHNNTNLYIAGVPASWTVETLRHLAEGFGEVTESRLMPQQSGHATLSGFVRFARRAESDNALERLEGLPVGPDGPLCDSFGGAASTSVEDRLARAHAFKGAPGVSFLQCR